MGPPCIVNTTTYHTEVIVQNQTKEALSNDASQDDEKWAEAVLF